MGGENIIEIDFKRDVWRHVNYSVINFVNVLYEYLNEKMAG